MKKILKEWKSFLKEEQESLLEINRDVADEVLGYREEAEGAFFDDIFGGEGVERVAVPMLGRAPEGIRMLTATIKHADWKIDYANNLVSKDFTTERGTQTRKMKIGKYLQKQKRLLQQMLAETDYYKKFELLKKNNDFVDTSSTQQDTVELPTDAKLDPQIKEETLATRVRYIDATLDRRLENVEENIKYWNENSEYFINNPEKATSGDPTNVMIASRHPIDVVRMSDFQGVQSCHSPNAGYFHCARDEAKNGGFIAYLVGVEDLKLFLYNNILYPNDGEVKDFDSLSPEELAADEVRQQNFKKEMDEMDFGILSDYHGELFSDGQRGIRNLLNRPISRIRVRRFVHDEEGWSVAIPETKAYGAQVLGFYDFLKKWLKKKQPDMDEDFFHNLAAFSLTGGSYEDTNSNTLFSEYFDTTELDGYANPPSGNDATLEENVENFQAETIRLENELFRDKPYGATTLIEDPREYNDGPVGDIPYSTIDANITLTFPLGEASSLLHDAEEEIIEYVNEYCANNLENYDVEAYDENISFTSRDKNFSIGIWYRRADLEVRPLEDIVYYIEEFFGEMEGKEAYTLLHYNVNKFIHEKVLKEHNPALDIYENIEELQDKLKYFRLDSWVDDGDISLDFRTTLNRNADDFTRSTESFTNLTKYGILLDKIPTDRFTFRRYFLRSYEGIDTGAGYDDGHTTSDQFKAECRKAMELAYYEAQKETNAQLDLFQKQSAASGASNDELPAGWLDKAGLFVLEKTFNNQTFIEIYLELFVELKYDIKEEDFGEKRTKDLLEFLSVLDSNMPHVIARINKLLRPIKEDAIKLTKRDEEHARKDAEYFAKVKQEKENELLKEIVAQVVAESDDTYIQHTYTVVARVAVSKNAGGSREETWTEIRAIPNVTTVTVLPGSTRGHSDPSFWYETIKIRYALTGKHQDPLTFRARILLPQLKKVRGFKVIQFLNPERAKRFEKRTKALQKLT